MSVLIRNPKVQDYIKKSTFFLLFLEIGLHSLLAIIRTGSLPATQREERPIER